MSYDYEHKRTSRWGMYTNQGLVWTVNITKPGTFQVISEDNGNNDLSIELMTPSDTLVIFQIGIVTSKLINQKR